MDKKLFKTREDIYKKCPSIFWEVSIFAIIVGIALVALDTIVPSLYLVTFGFIFFPILYATFMTLFTIKFGGTVTLKSTFAISSAYFKRNNFGCFRIIKNFLKAILVFIIAFIILSFALEAVFEYIYGSLFLDTFQVYADLTANGDVEGLVNFLASDNVFVFYSQACMSLSTSVAIVAFIFGIAFTSPNVYLSANIPGATAAFSNAIFKRFLRNKLRSYRKDFWSLNWPLFALLIIGMITGYALIFGLDIEFTYALPISSMMGLLFLIPFAPYFFAGTEALFAKYNEDMRKASVDLTQGFLHDLRNNINISEEDKAKIDELLSKGMNNNEEQEDNNSQG